MLLLLYFRIIALVTRWGFFLLTIQSFIV